ncbi:MULTISPECIES: universal stress protein [Aphanothece]|uniref:universal stress protein n=1 Tax=Aphanothece TaxID=1121 RepID=UPI00398EAD48
MPYQHILVPTDGSDLSGKAVEQAVDLARHLGAHLSFLHVQSNFPISLVGVGELVDTSTVESLVQAARVQADQILEAALATAAAAGVPARRINLVSPQPYQAIVDEAAAKACDLIVMASHGRRGITGLLLGSETQRVLTHSPIPVLVVR